VRWWPVFRKEKFPFSAGTWRNWGLLEGKSLARYLAFRSALPRSFLAAALCQPGGRNQKSSTTRVRPSSNRSSADCHPGRWSKPSGSGLEGFRGRLKRFGGTCIFVFAERCPKLSRVFGLQWLTGGPYTTVAKPLSAAWETAGQANHLRFGKSPQVQSRCLSWSLRRRAAMSGCLWGRLADSPGSSLRLTRKFWRPVITGDR